MRRTLPLLTAPAAGCDCRRCPWYAGTDALDPSKVIAPLCSGSSSSCSYCGCARAEAAATVGAPVGASDRAAVGASPCSQCPVRCGSRTDIDAWMQDLGGTLEFDDLVVTGALPAGLPRFIPQVDGTAVGSTWDTQLRWPAYGLGLRRVFSAKTHTIAPRFVGADAHDVLQLRRGQLAVLVGYGEDPLVEAFWTRRRRDRLIEQIAAQNWDLVLACNYSIYGNWPRAQHLMSMRMALQLAAEFSAAGVPAVPNIYWYRLEDLRRYADWIADAAPPAVAINLQTVRENTNWDTWALPGLHWLAENLPADLPVILTGLSRASRIATAVDLFGPRLHLVSQNPQQYALHGAVMTAAGREDRHARPVDAFTTSVHHMNSLLSAAGA